ncbi:serine/threonine-protein kinase [Nocardia shimofusensis]|uniref:serine/threonine-protein kinase n=1 Tax=Nocardia shimofusensis TaxID=228596 RepID=UPI00082CF230|nr:serine/threonine-protein kinase [Nocardia shimofusensis]
MVSERVVVDGRFELLEPLGSGGMGTVWRAYDVALHREVALKEVRPADPESSAGAPGVQRERVLREARALARIGHPNVVAVHHIVESPPPGHPWIVMELVRGRSLSDRLADGPISPEEAALIGRGILAGLRAAHQVGVLHRDIKPANALLREDGSPVLTDFGIAALHDATGLTGTGNLVGSLDYIAPERLAGQEGNPASDLWSLGLLLFVAVEGYHPMRRDTTVATLAAVLQGTVPAPRRAGPLAPVLGAVLVPQPERRPSTEELDLMLTQVITAPGGSWPSPAVSGPNPAVPGAHTTDSGPPRSGPYPVVPGPYSAESGPRPQSTWPESTPYPAVSGYASPGYAAPAGGHPSGPPGYAAPAPYPGPSRRSALTPVARVGLAAAAALTVAAIVTAVVVLRPGTGQTSATGTATTTGATTVPSGPGTTGTSPTKGAQITAADSTTADLLTPDGVRAAVAALGQLAGGTEFTEFTVYPNYANASAPLATQPGLYDEYSYRNGVATREGAGGELDDDDVTIRLDSIDWNVLPALFATANAELGVPNPTLRYLIVEPAWTFNDGKPTLLVYLTDDYGGAYLAANLDGSIVTMYPRGR